MFMGLVKHCIFFSGMMLFQVKLVFQQHPFYFSQFEIIDGGFYFFIGIVFIHF